MQCVCDQDAIQGRGHDTREHYPAREISLHGNNRDSVQARVLKSGESGTIAIHCVDAAAGLEQTGERLRERPVAGSKIGPHAGAPWNGAGDQRLSVIDLHQ